MKANYQWHKAPKELPDRECVCVTHYDGGYHINVWNSYYRTWDDSESSCCEFDSDEELDWMAIEIEEEESK